MTKIKNIDSAEKIFVEAALNHSEAIELGNYKIANKNYDHVIKAVLFLKSQKAISNLSKLLTHSSLGVRLAAATFLLDLYPIESEKTLKEIVNSQGIHSFRAETILSEWKNGNLKL